MDMERQDAPADSPFPWTAYSGSDLASVPQVPQAAPVHGYNWFPFRDIDIPAVRVALDKDGMQVIERESQRLIRRVHFPHGFPLGHSKSFPYSDYVQAAIAPDGSVVFRVGLRLYLWQFATGRFYPVADVEHEPKAMAISPLVRRVAVLTYPYVQGQSEWVAHVWSLPDGARLAELHWSTIWGGTLGSFQFSGDGCRLLLSTDVTAQSGSDFTDDHIWDIGVGPESLDEPGA